MVGEYHRHVAGPGEVEKGGVGEAGMPYLEGMAQGQAVLREALSNAARHAKATRVEVVLEVGDSVQLVVRDDGVGLPEDELRRSGLGNLAERAALMGGTFSAASRPGGGTELVWTAPIDGRDS